MQTKSALPKKYEKAFSETILPRLGAGEKTNIFYSTSYLNGNYYHLYQLLQAAELAKYQNAELFLAIADMSYTKMHSDYPKDIFENRLERIGIHLNEIKSLLVAHGVEEKRIHLHRMSDLWTQSFSEQKALLLSFYEGFNHFTNVSLEIPPEHCKKFYLPIGTKYSISYLVKKYTGLFLGTFFDQMFPSEIDGKMNLLLLGDSGSPLTLQLHESLVEANIFPEYSPIPFKLEGIPFCGHDKSVSKLSVPHWNMSAEEIYSILEQYKFSKEYIQEVDEKLLSKYLESVQGKIDASMQIKKQRSGLANKLYEFFQQEKKKTYKQYAESIEIKGGEDYKKYAKILRSELALQILRQCNGENSVSEIAKNLDKHISNVSAIIAELKKEGFVESTSSGKPRKIVKTINLSL